MLDTWENRKKIYTDVWGVHKKHYALRQEGKLDYDSLVKDVTALKEKYNNNFCTALCVAVLEDF